MNRLNVLWLFIMRFCFTVVTASFINLWISNFRALQNIKLQTPYREFVKIWESSLTGRRVSILHTHASIISISDCRQFGLNDEPFHITKGEFIVWWRVKWTSSSHFSLKISKHVYSAFRLLTTLIFGAVLFNVVFFAIQLNTASADCFNTIYRTYRYHHRLYQNPFHLPRHQNYYRFHNSPELSE